MAAPLERQIDHLLTRSSAVSQRLVAVGEVIGHWPQGPRAHLGCIAANVAAVTWCWATDLHASATCTYDREQSFEIVRLRGGVCYPAGVYRRDQFRCELIGCNISCSRCHKKDPGSLMMAGFAVSRCLKLLRLLDSAAAVSGMGVAALPAYCVLDKAVAVRTQVTTLLT